MHRSPSLGFLGGHGIVGGHIPLTTGMAFAAKYRNTNQVAVCYFGEAAVNNGAFHEALNMAALWKLPAIYLCENNRYGMGTALERASALYDISERACSYDMANEVVDGQDVLTMNAAMERAVQRARNEKLPPCSSPQVTRHGPSMSDRSMAHRTGRSRRPEQARPIAVGRSGYRGWEMDESAVRSGQEVSKRSTRYQFADQAPEPGSRNFTPQFMRTVKLPPERSEGSIGYGIGSFVGLAQDANASLGFHLGGDLMAVVPI